MYSTYGVYIVYVVHSRELAMTTLTVTDARQHWSELLNSVAFRGERVRLRRNGSDIAAVVSAADAELLELIEDHLDLSEVKNRLADGKKPLSYVDVRATLGLT